MDCQIWRQQTSKHPHRAASLVIRLNSRRRKDSGRNTTRSTGRKIVTQERGGIANPDLDTLPSNRRYSVTPDATLGQTTLEEIKVTMPAKRAPGPPKPTGETSEEMRALFGANFRQARLKARLTQVDVEKLTGIRQHYISEVENGVHNLTIDTMTTLARAIGAELRSLLRRPPKRD
jgi:DNA-binding XRE family transcriptional regulator